MKKKIANKKQDDKVKIVINGIKVSVNKSSSILEAARSNEIHIPHFCYHKRLDVIGACRMCVVEVEGARNLQASCSTPVREGMIISTHSKRVIEARRVILELLLANHDLNCLTCRKNLNCRLQKYSKDLMIEHIRYEGEKTHYDKDFSSPSIVRDPDKCILCGKCIRVCNDIQTVYAIERFNRGFYMGIGSAYSHNLNESACVNCGQCVVNCPTGALLKKSDIGRVVEVLREKESGKSNKHLIVQTAPSIRATLGECFGMPAGTDVTGKMVTALIGTK